ncbi:MAG TPA: serine hydrolase domain-containing protein [bacterium]|nr:serine hydrolase domain-containing protein [bacterium]
MRYSMFFLFLFVSALFVACDGGGTKPTNDDDITAQVDEMVNDDQTDQPDLPDLSGDEDTLLPDGDTVPLCEELSAIVTPYIDETGVADKAIGMIVRVESGDISETCTFGAREKGTTAPPTGDELWVIGSVSKMLTAHLIARKVVAGELALADSAASHLPQGLTAPTGPGGEPFTVEQLLTHTTGLPHYPATLQASLDAVAGLDDMYAAWEGYTLNDLITDLAATTITAVPGTTYGYSDFGFALAQQVIETVYAFAYSDVVVDLAQTMGLENTVDPAYLTQAQKENLFYGHAGPQLVPATRPVITPIFTGDGFLYSNAADLGRLLRVFAGIDEPPDATTTAALALATQKLFHREVSGVPVDQGLGLGVIASGDYTLYKKNGTSTGTTTAFLWDAEHHIGVVVAGNVIPFSEGVNSSVCAVFAAAAARSGLTVPTEVLTACQVPF